MYTLKHFQTNTKNDALERVSLFKIAILGIDVKFPQGVYLGAFTTMSTVHLYHILIAYSTHIYISKQIGCCKYICEFRR